MTNFTSIHSFRTPVQVPESGTRTGASPPVQPTAIGSDPDLIVLVVAMLVMLAALQMLKRALAPLREVLRAVASAAFAAMLITSALVLVLYAVVSGAH